MRFFLPTCEICTKPFAAFLAHYQSVTLANKIGFAIAIATAIAATDSQDSQNPMCESDESDESCESSP